MCKALKYSLFRLYNNFKTIIKSGKNYSVIYNVNGVDEARYTKRALLIYITEPFFHKDDSPGHQNRRQVKQIAGLLDESGYIVDVVDIRDRKYRPSKNYDIVICNRVSDIPLKNDAIRIYLTTALCHKAHNENLRKRHERLHKRRGCRIQLRRVYPETIPYVLKSDAIIGIGNASTWNEVYKGPIYHFNNYGFKETEFLISSKNLITARKNFLFFCKRKPGAEGVRPSARDIPQASTTPPVHMQQLQE